MAPLTWGPCGSWSNWRSTLPLPTSGQSAPEPDGTPDPKTELMVWHWGEPRRPQWRERRESSLGLGQAEKQETWRHRTVDVDLVSWHARKMHGCFKKTTKWIHVIYVFSLSVVKKTHKRRKKTKHFNNLIYSSAIFQIFIIKMDNRERR